MKKGFIGLLILILCAFVQFAYGATAVSGRPAPGVVAAASCTTSNDSAIINYTGDTPGGTHNVYIGGSAAQKFTLGATTTITEYKIYLADVNNEGSITVALYTDNSNAVGTVIDGTTVTIAASEIAAGPSVITFTLSTPKTGLTAGSYWLREVGSGTGTPTFTVSFVGKAGARILNETTYFDDYAHLVGIWGCAE